MLKISITKRNIENNNLIADYQGVRFLIKKVKPKLDFSISRNSEIGSVAGRIEIPVYKDIYGAYTTLKTVISNDFVFKFVITMDDILKISETVGYYNTEIMSQIIKENIYKLNNSDDCYDLYILNRNNIKYLVQDQVIGFENIKDLIVKAYYEI